MAAMEGSQPSQSSLNCFNRDRRLEIDNHGEIESGRNDEKSRIKIRWCEVVCGVYFEKPTRAMVVGGFRGTAVARWEQIIIEAQATCSE
jgi:hypothetical protein